MATAAQWIEGARPRTLPAAVAPVLAGTGVAAYALVEVWWKAALAMVVSVALQVGVNYANDYSDGVRGTDADRVGPLRLVGSGVATPRAVLLTALGFFALAATAGVVLAALTSWWLVVVGAAAIAAAWTYTGGPLPYGYRALGEAAVFVFFGLVAVLGTAYVQVGRITGTAVLVAVPVGLLACAVLVANNLRDLAGDKLAGKRTLAVLLGDHATRAMYTALVGIALVVVLGGGMVTRWLLLGLLAAPLAVMVCRPVLRGATGPALIVTLKGTGQLALLTACLIAIGLALSRVG